MATIDQAKELLPAFNFANSGLIIGMFFLIILILIAFAILMFILIRHLKYNRQITILEDVQGADDLEPIGKDKAMLVKVGKGGTELLYLKKRKLYRGAYGKRMGKNKYYFAIGADGYWYNITLGSLEKGMQKVGIKPTVVNMRYQNEALMELIKERYEQVGFWKQYGALVVQMGFFVLVAVMFWLYFSEMKEIAPAMVEAANALREGADYFRQAVGGLDSLRASGGIAPAVWLGL